MVPLDRGLTTAASSTSTSGHVVTSENENWLVAPKKDATRNRQHWESMLSASTDSGKGGVQVGGSPPYDRRFEDRMRSSAEYKPAKTTEMSFKMLHVGISSMHIREQLTLRRI